MGHSTLAGMVVRSDSEGTRCGVALNLYDKKITPRPDAPRSFIRPQDPLPLGSPAVGSSDDHKPIPFRLKIRKHFIKKRFENKEIIRFHPPRNPSCCGGLDQKRKLPRLTMRLDENGVFPNFFNGFLKL